MSPSSRFKAWKPLGENHIEQKPHSCRSFHFCIIYTGNAQPLSPSLQTTDMFTMGTILFYTTCYYGHNLIMLFIMNYFIIISHLHLHFIRHQSLEFSCQVMKAGKPRPFYVLLTVTGTLLNSDLKDLVMPSPSPPSLLPPI